jgi:hypothetical protein
LAPIGPWKEAALSISVGRVSLVIAVLALACGVVAAQAVAQAVPAVPGVQTERFRVVVEGTTSAVRDLDLGANTGVCASEVNVHVTETATYQRGRGLIVEFVRLGPGPRAPVVMTRPGYRIPVFTVAVSVTRQSTGSASRSNLTANDVCVPVTESLDGGPECGVAQPDRANLSMTFERGALRLRLSGLGAVSDIRCPVSQVYGGTPDLRYGWPTPVALRPEPIPRAQIFGTARVVVARAVSGTRRTTMPISAGALSGSATDFGSNRATIRLIRLT